VTWRENFLRENYAFYKGKGAGLLHRKIFAISLASFSHFFLSASTNDPAASNVRIRADRLSQDVVADGLLTDAEWSRATRVKVDGGATISFQSNARHLAFAVATRELGPLFVDVFVERGDGIANLHASFKLGERALSGSSWSDSSPPTAWGRTTGWMANAVRQRKDAAPGAEFETTLEPYDGFEFVLERAVFGTGVVRLRIEARDFLGKKADVVFPARSARYAPHTWATILPNAE
jgi:hypothetical protein